MSYDNADQPVEDGGMRVGYTFHQQLRTANRDGLARRFNQVLDEIVEKQTVITPKPTKGRKPDPIITALRELTERVKVLRTSLHSRSHQGD